MDDTTVTVRLSNELYKQLERVAEYDMRSVENLASFLIVDFLRRVSPPQPEEPEVSEEVVS